MRKLLFILLLVMSSVALNAKISSGKCGDHLRWKLDPLKGTLIITGTGSMYDWDFSKSNYTPWMEHFEVFKNVHTVILPEGLTTIGRQAFTQFYSLKNIAIPSTVSKIGHLSFYCSGIEYIYIPQGVQKISHSAFSTCHSLTSIEVDKNNKNYSSVDGILYNKEKTILLMYPENKKGSSFVVPSSVKIISSWAFDDCKNLTQIIFHNKMDSLKEYAFYNCETLKTISLPRSIKFVDKTAFKGCTQLKEINYPRGLDVSKLEIPTTTKLVAYDVDLPNPTSPTPAKKTASIKWMNFQSTSQYKNYSFKVGIKSESKIEETKVYVNDNIERGIFPVLKDGYDMTISKNITLAEGENIIKIVVKNADGEAVSERVVTYSEKKASPNNQQRRIALVMGNANYMDADKRLKNPTNDATDMAAKLESLGFTVIRSLDQTQQGMEKAINDFGDRIKNYDAALFYYAGHGMRSEGYNYLVPIDANLPEESFVKYKCINANMVLDIMEKAQCPMKIIILDACRNNPFARTWNRGIENEGLGVMVAPKGTFVAFSTAPGEVAKDGIGRNSPYTAAILQTLDIPNLALMDFFQEVLEKVSKETGNSQTPWISGSFRGKFYFNQK